MCRLKINETWVLFSSSLKLPLLFFSIITLFIYNIKRKINFRLFILRLYLVKIKPRLSASCSWEVWNIYTFLCIYLCQINTDIPKKSNISSKHKAQLIFFIKFLRLIFLSHTLITLKTSVHKTSPVLTLNVFILTVISPPSAYVCIFREVLNFGKT